MSGYIVIKEENPDSPDAARLMDELSDALKAITGDSGRSSFSTEDACGPRSIFVIACRDGEAVGCGALRPIDDDIAEVKRMYAKQKGMGIGTKILSYLESKAREMGYSALRLETRRINRNAVLFYEKSGYHRIPNYGKYADRPEAVCFEKQLMKGL